jgi:hypothetical protein
MIGKQNQMPLNITAIDPREAGWHPLSQADDSEHNFGKAGQQSDPFAPPNASESSSGGFDAPFQAPSKSLLSRLRGTKVDVVGAARGFQARTETNGNDRRTSIVWTFRLQRFDETSGNELPPVPVEMRGRHFKGFINEGDRVEVHGRLKAGHVVRAKRVHNLTTDVWVESHRWM